MPVIRHTVLAKGLTDPLHDLVLTASMKLRKY